MSAIITAAIGCDPGANTGLAVFRWDAPDTTPVWVELLKNVGEVDPWVRAQALGRIQRECGVTPEQTYFSVEDQFLHLRKDLPIEKQRGQFQATASIIRNAATWQAIARARCYVASARVHPSTWQSSYGIAGKKRKQGQEITAEIVKRRFAHLFQGQARRLLSESIDVQCAVLIAAHTARELGFGPFHWIAEERARHMMKTTKRRRKRRESALPF